MRGAAQGRDDNDNDNGNNFQTDQVLVSEQDLPEEFGETPERNQDSIA